MRLTRVLFFFTTVVLSSTFLVRKFDTTPARWVQSLRIEAAMQHLEDRSTSLGTVARMTGFRDEQALRQAFFRQTGVTPKQYRERFGELDRNRAPHLAQSCAFESRINPSRLIQFLRDTSQNAEILS